MGTINKGIERLQEKEAETSISTHVDVVFLLLDFGSEEAVLFFLLVYC